MAHQTFVNGPRDSGDTRFTATFLVHALQLGSNDRNVCVQYRISTAVSELF